MSTGKVVKGILAGAVAGALLGVLLAPDSGDKTRKKISKKGTDFTDLLKAKFNDFVDNIAGKFENLKMKEQDGTDSKMGSEKEMAANIKAEAKKMMS